MKHPKNGILIKGARLHNLKNIDVAIPRHKLVVITGLSGSGKSSLAFDTLYAEGQRRYVESLSSYARQFLGRLDKPKVDNIIGIAPAIAIEQKVNTSNPRSTVGTATEVYDYLKLLYARIGRTYSPISGKEVKKHTVSHVLDYIKGVPEGVRLLLLAPLEPEEGRSLADKLKALEKQGYVRIKHNGTVSKISGFDAKKPKHADIQLVVDRIVVRHEEDFYNRLGDAVELAFYEGHGRLVIEAVDDDRTAAFSNKYEADGMTFLEPNAHLFSFNNPYGACPKCEGYGDTIGIDPGLVIPNTVLSVYDNAIAPWRGERTGWFRDRLIEHAHKFDFPIHRPWFELTEAKQQLVWEGNKYFTGLDGFFEELEAKSYKIQNRVMLSRYRGKTRCAKCRGKRLRPEAGYVKIAGKAITDLIDLPVSQLADFFRDIEMTEYEVSLSKRLLKEITHRLQYLEDVGLGYLTLNRRSSTLSGGESQRINLATSLGSSLVGSMYILDEPSIGLHPRDTEKLIGILKSLRDLGNTVIVVEHDEDIIRAADHIIDIGPDAGTFGGEVTAFGSFEEILTQGSYTAKYLSGRMELAVPEKRRKPTGHITVTGARHNNLKNIDVRFPLGCFTAVTGVSGSGKSTLVRDILYPALRRGLEHYGDRPGQFSELGGEYAMLKEIVFVDQNPIGRSSRSNPVTYIKAYDDIRALFADQKISKLNGFEPKHFSFNVPGGRCEVCKGEGEVTVEMQFMADVHLECEACGGKRFQKEVLQVLVAGKNIDEVLRMTVDEAVAFFEGNKQTKIRKKLQPLQDVGLGYVQLGQSASTLSGGEAQRVKLASFLTKGQTDDKTLFIFDEPTTGLHVHDIGKLVQSFDALIDKGHSILVIEHNAELIKGADHLIDLGPEGGDAGGYLIAEGTPEEVAGDKASYTGKYLVNKLKAPRLKEKAPR